MILTIKGIISHKNDLVTEILHSNEFKQKQSGSQSEEKLMINNSESGRFFIAWCRQTKCFLGDKCSLSYVNNCAISNVMTWRNSPCEQERIGLVYQTEKFFRWFAEKILSATNSFAQDTNIFFPPVTQGMCFLYLKAHWALVIRGRNPGLFWKMPGIKSSLAF